MTALPDFPGLKARVDLVSFIEAHGVDLHKTGSYYEACCPFHTEKTPSFVVWPETAKWHCFGACGVGGDVFDFVQRYDATITSKAAAFRYVEDHPGSGFALPAAREKKPRPAISAKPSKAWRDHAAAVADRAIADLDAAKRDYLRDVRGFNANTIDLTRIGFITQETADWSREAGYSVHTGLSIRWPDSDGIFALRIRRIVGNLAKALGVKLKYDAKGRAIDAKGRAIDKYTSLKGSKPSSGFYDASLVLRCKLLIDALIVICEGEFDAIIGAQTLPSHHWLTLGSAGARLTAEQAEQFAGKTVRLALDNDAPGRAGRERLISTLIAAGAILFNVALPDGVKDITEAVTGGHDLAAILAAATPIDPTEYVTATKAPVHIADGTIGSALHSGQPLTNSAIGALLNIAEPFAQIGVLIAETGVSRVQPATIADFVAASDVIGAEMAYNTIWRAVRYGVEQGILQICARDFAYIEKESEEERGKGSPSANLQNGSESYQLADPKTLAAVFRKLAELPSVVQAFAQRRIVPMPRADLLASYEPEILPIAGQLADHLKAAIGDLITAQPEYADRAVRSERFVERHTSALARAASGQPICSPFPTIADLKVIVLQRHVKAHNGEPISGAYLSHVANCGERSLPRYLGAGKVKSKPNPEFRDVTAAAAKQIASYTARFKRAPYDKEFGGSPSAIAIGDRRFELAFRPTHSDAERACEVQRVQAEAMSALAVIGNLRDQSVRVEYRRADIRTVDPAAVPDVLKRKSTAVVPIEVTPDKESAVKRDRQQVADRGETPNNADRPLPGQQRIDHAVQRYVEAYLSMATSWRVRDGQLVNCDQDSGEILPYTRANVIALLAGLEAPDRWPDNELDIQAMCQENDNTERLPVSVNQPLVDPIMPDPIMMQSVPVNPAMTKPITPDPIMTQPVPISRINRRPLMPCPRCSTATNTGSLCCRCDPARHIGERVEVISANKHHFSGEYIVTADGGLPPNVSHNEKSAAQPKRAARSHQTALA